MYFAWCFVLIWINKLKRIGYGLNLVNIQFRLLIKREFTKFGVKELVLDVDKNISRFKQIFVSSLSGLPFVLNLYCIPKKLVFDIDNTSN